MVESIDMARRLLDAPALMLSSPEQIKSALLKAGMDVEDTSAETLASIDHDGVRAILAFRMHQKTCEQAAKYIRELCEDGRIHSQFNPLGTVTGRFSSENPTLHNVKRGVIRTAFEAGEGMALVVSDYSQIELRAAAAISGDKAMLEAFERREDLHIKTASMILRKAETDITAEERQTAKAANFGLIFGLGAKGLVRDARNKFGVSLTIEQAADIRKSFFAAYPGIASWHKTAWREAAAMNGLAGRFACTITGRRRLIKQDCDEWTRFTTLVNTPVQGACGDGIKIAMIRIAALLPRTAQMVATIHDELVFVCPSDEADSLREMVAAEMKAAMSELFPQLAIEVEAKVCNNWGEK
jgi:DNA polymerase-1